MSTLSESKLTTPANLLSLSRIVATPFIFYLIVTSDDGSGGFVTVLFLLAAFTDFLDGMFARSTDTVTEFGKVLDPVADRILISGTIIALTIAGALPIIGVVLVVARDVLLVIGYKAIERRGLTVRVSLLGKSYTALFMLAIIMIMGGIEPGGHQVGLWLFWISVIGSLVSGVSYMARAIIMLRARDAVADQHGSAD
jgi:CDP-diacylglycerol--glycerol-3-phosphate 3-phosphatidyltransferase